MVRKQIFYKMGRLSRKSFSCDARSIALAVIVHTSIEFVAGLNGAMTAGIFMAFQNLMGSFQAPVNKLLGLNQALQTTEMQMHRLDDVRRYDADKLNYPDEKNLYEEEI